MADVAVPGRLEEVPSPHMTMTEEIVPSGSVVVKVTVTVWPVLAGFGETFVIVTVGGRSLTVSVVVPLPGPALFVAVTVIVKVFDIVVPVDV